jgi:sec-independent protein translocase protein TatB
MFDITSSKLLLLAIVALLVIGPKEFPALLRTIGRYMGMIKRQAAEFRAQFDEAMREAELEQVKKEVEIFAQQTEESVRAAERSLDADLAAGEKEINAALETVRDTGERSLAPSGSGADGQTVPATATEKNAGEGMNGQAEPTGEPAPSEIASLERPEATPKTGT